MKANPGGEIAPTNIIGRDGLVAQLREILEQQSVVLVAERRIGKTSVIKKMRAEAPPELPSIYRDLEGIRTPVEFADQLYRDALPFFSPSKKVTSRVASMFKHFAGVEIEGVGKFPEILAPHWKSLVESTVEDLMTHQVQPFVIFWDELPLMLYNIADSSGDETAMEVLDTLRGLRQTYGIRLPMVFTGSVGLHHVVASLRESGHLNPATNDMRVVEVPPLATADAEFLASELLNGEGLVSNDRAATAQHIAHLGDQIPYYIHCLVRGLKDRGIAASPELADSVLSKSLVADQDPWHFQHYLDRLKIYYGPDRQPVALALLDELAADSSSMTLSDLHTRMKLRTFRPESATARKILDGDRDSLIDLVRLLRSDHYLTQFEDGDVTFRFPLINRWWQMSRGL